MTELEAKALITQTVEDLVEGEKVAVAERKPSSRLEHTVTFVVVFRHDEQKELEVIKAIKDLTFKKPDLFFGGTVVNDKFDMQSVAVLVIATIK
ncbi:MAG: hypothetical protein WA945_09940 [Arcobacteraceae bacterium]